MTAGGAGIEARSVGFGYGSRALFESFSLSIPPGEMAGVIGANGSGKTTLLRILSGVLAPRSGGVRLTGAPGGDVELAALDPGARSRRIAVVPQESRLTFDVTALEVVLMARAARLGLLGIESASDLAAAQRAMERTGTLPFAGRLIGQLSGGERQLVFLARALAQEPGILLLDEPTAFLDIRHRLEIYALLSDLNAREGLTVVTTSHDINLAARFCRRLVLMKAGRVIADGPTAQVFRAEILSELFDTPLRILKDEATGSPFAVP